MPRHRPVPLLLVTLALLPAGCDKPPAMGSANAIVLGTPTDRWMEVRDEVEERLEPRVFTVRDERMFNVTHMDPGDQRWARMREFRRVLVIGEPDEPFMRDALRAVRADTLAPPAVAEARNVWARDQQVIVVLLPPGSEPGAALPLMDEVHQRVQQDFGRWVFRRMYASGLDTARIDTLAARTGARLRIPAIYRTTWLDERTAVHINDQPDPSELVRSVLLTWRPGATPDPAAEDALEWRQRLETEAYGGAQVTDTDRLETHAVEVGGAAGIQVQGIWTNPPEQWPAAGSFVTRLLSCPAQDRTYLVDGWLYAPARAKYEYLLQIATILDSFTC